MKKYFCIILLFIASCNTLSQNQFQQFELGDSSYVTPKFSPNSYGYMFLEVQRGFPLEYDLWYVNSEQNAQKIFDNIIDFTWSHNQNVVLISSLDGLKILDLSDLKVAQVYNDGTAGYDLPAYSPSENKIAYRLRGDVWVVSADGSDPINLTRNLDGSTGIFDWVSDSEVLVLNQRRVFLIDTETAKNKLVINHANTFDVSMNTNNIVYTDGEKIYLTDIDGTAIDLLIESNGVLLSGVNWSPDNKYIAYTSTIEEGTDLFIFENDDPSTSVNLTENLDCEIILSFSWSYDSKYISLSCSPRLGSIPSNIWIIDIKSKELWNVTGG